LLLRIINSPPRRRGTQNLLPLLQVNGRSFLIVKTTTEEERWQ
jgi:hypothetical protein